MYYYIAVCWITLVEHRGMWGVHRGTRRAHRGAWGHAGISVRMLKVVTPRIGKTGVVVLTTSNLLIRFWHRICSGEMVLFRCQSTSLM